MHTPLSFFLPTFHSCLTSVNFRHIRLVLDFSNFQFKGLSSVTFLILDGFFIVLSFVVLLARELKL